MQYGFMNQEQHLITIINDKPRHLKKKIRIWVVINADGHHVARFTSMLQATSVARRIDGRVEGLWALA